MSKTRKNNKVLSTKKLSTQSKTKRNIHVNKKLKNLQDINNCKSKNDDDDNNSINSNNSDNDESILTILYNKFWSLLGYN